jgi:hypothetical protein
MEVTDQLNFVNLVMIFNRIDGWRGFYFGSLPNLIKVLPASTVAYLTFEYFSSLFNING